MIENKWLQPKKIVFKLYNKILTINILHTKLNELLFVKNQLY